MSEMVRTFVVRRPETHGKQSCTYTDLNTVIDAEFTDAEVGDVISITIGELTQEQVDALPEFEGW